VSITVLADQLAVHEQPFLTDKDGKYRAGPFPDTKYVALISSPFVPAVHISFM